MSARALSVEEILELPAAVDLVTAGRCLDIGRTRIHEMARSGELEALGLRLLRLGRSYRVRRSDLIELLGLGPPSGERSSPQPTKPRATSDLNGSIVSDTADMRRWPLGGVPS